jgi:hypothetical protein
MTTTNMARLNDMVRMTITGALDGVIRLEMFNVLKEFFQRTDAWLLELPVYVNATGNDYVLETGQNVIVNRLMGLDRLSLPPSGVSALPLTYLPMCPPQYLMASQSGNVSEGTDPSLRVQRAGVLLNAGAKCPILRISENPNANEIWVATLALNVCDPVDAEGFTQPPDWVMEKYLNYLACGVKAALMLQPGKPYTSLPGAQYNGRKFNEGIGLCRTEVRRLFTYGSQRWQYPSGWNAGYRRGGMYVGHQ